MSCKRYAAKRDSNENEIVDALKACGATVQKLSEKNVPDLLVGFRNKNFLIEIKSETGQLSRGQQEWHRSWSGSVFVVKSVADILNLLYDGKLV